MSTGPNRLSTWIIAIIGIILFAQTISNKHLKDDSIIQWDIQEYYMYLPAIVIYHDPGFSFVQNLPPDLKSHYWLHSTPSGRQTGRMALGMTIAYLPLFLVAHAAAQLLHYPVTGFSHPYQMAVLCTGLLFSFIGFIFLRKLLLRFFPDSIVALTILIIALATNLFYYITDEGGMTHATLFGLFCLYFYCSVRWHENPKLKYLLPAAFALTLAALIRPTSALAALIFVFYGVTTADSIKAKIRLWLSRWQQLLIALIGAFILISVQLFYWKYISGQWFYYSYTDERFFFNHPVILHGLLGFRKGWLIYTPVMILAIAGMAFLGGKLKLLFWPLLAFLILNTYIVLSWWCWWYGGSFGLRAFIESYAFLAVPMAAFVQWCARRKWTLALCGIFVAWCLFLNIFQTIQYRETIIHYDSMTRRAYIYTFLKMRWPSEDMLNHPDYEKAMKGER
jgi:hypothetical protein